MAAPGETFPAAITVGDVVAGGEIELIPVVVGFVCDGVAEVVGLEDVEFVPELVGANELWFVIEAVGTDVLVSSAVVVGSEPSMLRLNLSRKKNKMR